MCPIKDITTKINAEDKAGHCQREEDGAVGVEGRKCFAQGLALRFGEIWAEVRWAREECQDAVDCDEGKLDVKGPSPSQTVTEEAT